MAARTYEAYRFQPAGAPFARFYTPGGEDLERRLVPSPLDSWEQITSLLKDGRKHKGVDFKTPVGSPVKATFDGTIIEWLVEDGDPVNAGQPLVRLQPEGAE